MDRFKGILSERTFRYRNTVHIVDSIFRDPSSLRKGRKERQLGLPAGVQKSGKFRSDVAAKGGICLFIDIADTGAPGTLHQPGNDVISLIGRQVAGLRINHQYAGLMGRKIHIWVYHYAS